MACHALRIGEDAGRAHTVLNTLHVEHTLSGISGEWGSGARRLACGFWLSQQGAGATPSCSTLSELSKYGSPVRSLDSRARRLHGAPNPGGHDLSQGDLGGGVGRSESLLEFPSDCLPQGVVVP